MSWDYWEQPGPMWTRAVGRGARLVNYPVPDWRIAELRAMPYDQYLLTEEWRRTRHETILFAGERCERCGSRFELQVHHRTYVNLGQENPDDLEVLCGDCHADEHEK